MKATKLFLTAALSVASTCAFAQFANSSSSSSIGGSSAGEDSYKRLEVGFSTGTMKYDGHDADESEKGATVGLIYGNRLTQSMPLFLESGFKMTWLTRSDSEDGLDAKFNYLNLAIPVNLVYKFAVTDAISINPYAGLNLKVNLVAKEKYEYDGESESYSYFDKDDVEDTWNRFQVGANIGVGINFKSLYLGYNFNPDFMEIAKKVKYPSHTISLGVNF